MSGLVCFDYVTKTRVNFLIIKHFERMFNMKDVFILITIAIIIIILVVIVIVVIVILVILINNHNNNNNL